MKYEKTKYPNIQQYKTNQGTRYRIRKTYKAYNGSKKIYDKSGIKTIAEAKALLRQIEEDIDKNESEYIRSKTLTVSDYFKEFSHKKIQTGAWSLDTQNGNMSLFKNHIEPEYGKIPLTKLNRNQYEIFIANKLKVLRRSSVKSIHVLFMAILNDAVYSGSIPRNPLMRIQIGESTIPKKNKRLSYKDYHTWMTTAKEILTKYQYSILVLCSYGMRRGEILALRQSVVSYDDHPNLATLHIIDSRTQKEKQGKGAPKTESSIRYIVLDQKGTEALEYVINEAKEIKKDFGEILHADDFFIINPKTGEPFHPVILNRWFDQVGEKCGIKVSPHMLRHYFATQAAISGAPKDHVAAYLGHHEKTMTQYYTHIENETAAGVIDLVSKRLS